jgi:hypothetical protein
MSESRGSRFAFEVLFLIALAVAVALTDLEPIAIAGIMLGGWVVVAALEWAAWREKPHFGSGLPPRYYIPQVNLPPAQPLEQVSAGYPETRDEAPTWIASAALRSEMLGEWPVAAHPAPQPDDDAAEPEPIYDPDPWTYPEELPVAPLGELAPDPEPEPEPRVVPPPVVVAVQPDPDPEPDSEPEPEPDVESAPPEPVVEAVPEPAPVVAPEPVAEAVAEPEPEAAPEPEPEAAPEPEPPVELVLVHSAERVARWTVDPLAEPEPRRRFRRRGHSEQQAVEVPARPSGPRALPRGVSSQDRA